MRRRTGGRGRRARRGRASASLRWAGVCGAERARGFSGQLGRWEDFFCEARLFFIYLLRLFIWASAPTRKASTCGRGRGGLPPEQGAPGGAGARNPGTMTRTQGRPLTHWATQASLWSTFNLDTKVISVRPGSRLGRGRPSQCPLPVTQRIQWMAAAKCARETPANPDRDADRAASSACGTSPRSGNKSWTVTSHIFCTLPLLPGMPQTKRLLCFSVRPALCKWLRSRT